MEERGEVREGREQREGREGQRTQGWAEKLLDHNRISQTSGKSVAKRLLRDLPVRSPPRGNVRRWGVGVSLLRALLLRYEGLRVNGGQAEGGRGGSDGSWKVREGGEERGRGTEREEVLVEM